MFGKRHPRASPPRWPNEPRRLLHGGDLPPRLHPLHPRAQRHVAPGDRAPRHVLRRSRHGRRHRRHARSAQHIVTWSWIIAGLTLGSDHRRLDGGLRPHDRHAAANRALPRLRSLRRRARRRRRIPRHTAPRWQPSPVAHSASKSCSARSPPPVRSSPPASCRASSRGKPIQFRGQNASICSIFLGMTGCFVVFWLHPDDGRRLLRHARPCVRLRRHAGHPHRLAPTCRSSCRCSTPTQASPPPPPASCSATTSSSSPVPSTVSPASSSPS